MLESQIQKRILDYLKSRSDTWAVKIISCNRKGTPDILACISGRFFAFEVKRPSGTVAEIQKVQIKRIEDTGGVAAVVYSVEDVQKIIEKFFN